MPLRQTPEGKPKRKEKKRVTVICVTLVPQSRRKTLFKAFQAAFTFQNQHQECNSGFDVLHEYKSERKTSEIHTDNEQEVDLAATSTTYRHTILSFYSSCIRGGNFQSPVLTDT